MGKKRRGDGGEGNGNDGVGWGGSEVRVACVLKREGHSAV